MSFSSYTFIYINKVKNYLWQFHFSHKFTPNASRIFLQPSKFPHNSPVEIRSYNSQETNDLKIRVSRLSESLEFVTYKEHSNSRRNDKNIAICRQINHCIQKMRAAFFKA